MSNRVGNVKRIKASFYNEDGALASPATVRAEVTPPGASAPVVYAPGDPELQPGATGVYVLRVKLAAPGTYAVVVIGESPDLVTGVNAAQSTRIVATKE